MFFIFFYRRSCLFYFILKVFFGSTNLMKNNIDFLEYLFENFLVLICFDVHLPFLLTVLKYMKPSVNEVVS
jgi:hypothetical protein